MRRFLPALLLATVTATAGAQRVRRPTATADLDTYVARALRTFDVPGMALTVVRDGRVLTAGGYGVRRLGDTARVTADTRFGIASNTKGFTATALALLAERGPIALDTPVVRYLPEFALSDPYVTANITVRDLLSHRSGLGLGAGDLLWWPGTTYSRKEIMRRLRFLPLKHGFRDRYAYDNVLYLVAGELIETVSGKSWEQFITDELLVRMGMLHTTTRHSDAAAPGNVATTHAMVDGQLSAVPPMTSDITNAAGGINSTAGDMAKWMITLLNSGTTADSVALWRGWAQLQLWTGVTPMPVPHDGDLKMLGEMKWLKPMIDVQPKFSLYGLGFEVRDYRGHRIITHAGGLPGYTSRVTFLPELKLGISVLTNQESGDALDAVTRRVLDEHLGLGATDWTTILDSANTAMRAALARFRKESPDTRESLDSALRDTTTRPTLPPHKYAGKYIDPWYGTVTIDVSPAGALVLKMDATPGMIGDVTHWEHDVFTVRWRDRTLRADAYIWFQFDRDGKVESARMEPISRDVDFSFDFTDLRLRRTNLW
jgi:CubicO group peptidase (beta-lactamase class C family)